MSINPKNIFDVTIGICVKNGAKSISNALQSILNQIFDKSRMEILIVDDGSTDNTLQVISKNIQNSPVKTRILTGGKGLTASRQMVVDNAYGTFIIFVDDDMVLSKDFVKRQFEIMQEKSNSGVAQAIIHGKRNKNALSILEDYSKSENYETGMHRKWKKEPSKLGTGGSIFRTIAVKEAGGFDKAIVGAAEDADITTKIKSAGYLLLQSDAVLEHEFKDTLRGLWKQYAWYGYGMHYHFHKHRIVPEEMLVFFLPMTFGWSVIRSFLILKVARQKIVVFLPFYNSFRALAWWFGFFNAHRKHYGHNYRLFG